MPDYNFTGNGTFDNIPFDQVNYTSCVAISPQVQRLMDQAETINNHTTIFLSAMLFCLAIQTLILVSDYLHKKKMD